MSKKNRRHLPPSAHAPLPPEALKPEVTQSEVSFDNGPFKPMEVLVTPLFATESQEVSRAILNDYPNATKDWWSAAVPRKD